MRNCQFSNCTINFNTYKYTLSNFPFMSSIIFENSNSKVSKISSQLLCIFIEGKIKAIQLSVNVRVIFQSVLLSFFQFMFSMPSKVILIVIEFMFSGINMFWVLLSGLAARAKMSLSRAQNIFMPADINSIVKFSNS